MHVLTRDNWQGHLGQGLSLRQLEFTLAVACGLTDKQIAREADLEPGTVRKCLDIARFKLGAARRSQLIANAIRNGIIAPLAVLLMVCTVVIGGTPDLERAPRGKVRITRIAKAGSRDDLLYNPFDYV